MTDYLRIARAAMAGVSVAPKSTDPGTEAEPDPADLARASDVVNGAGVRIMQLEDVAAIGLWSDVDGPELRAALRTLKVDNLPVRYLDGMGIPMRFKVRRIVGEPVPMNVLNEMERQPAEPWRVRTGC